MLHNGIACSLWELIMAQIDILDLQLEQNTLEKMSDEQSAFQLHVVSEAEIFQKWHLLPQLSEK